LNKYRLKIEVEWFKLLASTQEITKIGPFSSRLIEVLDNIVKNFNLEEATKLKQIEMETRHDVKAVEYYLRRTLLNMIHNRELRLGHDIHSGTQEAIKTLEFIHFGCTSEDINNLAYALMIKEARLNILSRQFYLILEKLDLMSRHTITAGMVSRTHGQLASGTTMGKELLVFYQRLQRGVIELMNMPVYGKINGAVGNYNAHLVAYPAVNWLDISKELIENVLNLQMLDVTTQIEPHDYLARIFHGLIRINTVLIDLCRDIWSYISLGYFKLHMGGAGEVGSSTMPHKVNPIDFENAEGNLGLANALLEHMARKLPVSRLQRDLTDSTVMRNIGVAIGYGLIAYQSLITGLGKLEINRSVMIDELDRDGWVLLAEPIQTVMRKYGVIGGYEKVKAIFRGGHKVRKEDVWNLIDQLEELPPQIRDELKILTPGTYLGTSTDWHRV
jgi:adenylosuccinate lyase